MNYQESQILNFERCHAGIPEHLAVEALVERYFEGWDRTDIAALPADFDFRATEDWADLAKSPAWAHANPAAVCRAVKGYARALADESAQILGWANAEQAEEAEKESSCEWGGLLRTNRMIEELPPGQRERMRAYMDDPNVLFLADGGKEMLSNSDRSIAVIRKIIDPEILRDHDAQCVDAWVECLGSGGSDGWYSVLESSYRLRDLSDLPLAVAEQNAMMLVGEVYKDSLNLFPACGPVCEEVYVSGRERARMRSLAPGLEERWGLEVAQRAVFRFAAVKAGQLNRGLLVGPGGVDWDEAVRLFGLTLSFLVPIGVPGNEDCDRAARNAISQAVLVGRLDSRQKYLVGEGASTEAGGWKP